ncbi:MAG: hypothetical protein RXN86_03890 [Vulcanisaeta sp.]
MEIGIYYDYRRKDVGMESLKAVDDKIQSVLEEVKSSVKILGYHEVGNWLEEHGRKDLLLFFQDVMPYSAFNAEFANLFSKKSRLYGFLKRGGTVIWLGDVPFFYRIRCEKMKVDENSVRNKIGLLNSNFIKEKIGFKKITEDEVCYRDIISNAYIPIDILNPSILFPSILTIPIPTKYLGFLDISQVCYTNTLLNTNETVFGKLIELSSLGQIKGMFEKSHRPHKIIRNIVPLNHITLNEQFCKGEYSGSWIAEVEEGYFVRLFDYGSEISEENIKDSIKLGIKIAELQ